MREFFSKRGVTIGAGGLVVVVSANAVQAALPGLAATISTAAALAGTALPTSTTIAATKAIAMTTLQKTFIGATLAAAVDATGNPDIVRQYGENVARTWLNRDEPAARAWIAQSALPDSVKQELLKPKE